MKKGKSPRVGVVKSQKRILSKFWLFAMTILLLKVTWLLNQEGQGILGADGENYLEALDGLLTDGFFSQQDKLGYWPAGYPIMIWPIAKINLANFALMVGLFQSFIFALSTVFFAHELSLNSLRKFAWPSLILLNLSPTLSLNSVAIGYEVTASSLLLISLSFYLRMIRLKSKSILSIDVIGAAVALMFSTFMQPRTLLLAIGMLVPFAIFHFRGKLIPVFLAVSVVTISIAPMILIFRNLEANGYAAISTNLGVTMNIGAGPNANGGYSNVAEGVPCSLIQGNAAQQDNHKVKCVLEWYRQNPSKALNLFVNKFFFFWSPWFGPLANGTMARNPWLRFHPFAESVKTQEGYTMVFGAVGKTFSWGWMVGSLVLLVLGIRALWLRGGLSKLLAWILAIPVVLNMLTSIATIGDHRFRIQTLAFSSLLQMVGMYSLLSKNVSERGGRKNSIVGRTKY